MASAIDASKENAGLRNSIATKNFSITVTKIPDANMEFSKFSTSHQIWGRSEFTQNQFQSLKGMSSFMVGMQFFGHHFSPHKEKEWHNQKKS